MYQSFRELWWQIIEGVEEVDVQQLKDSIKSLKQQCVALRISSDRGLQAGAPRITLADALEALKQVKVRPIIENRRPHSATVLGQNYPPRATESAAKSRLMDEIKKSAPCFACGETGNWFKDRLSCTKDINTRIAQREGPHAAGLRPAAFERGG